MYNCSVDPSPTIFAVSKPETKNDTKECSRKASFATNSYTYGSVYATRSSGRRAGRGSTCCCSGWFRFCLESFEVVRPRLDCICSENHSLCTMTERVCLLAESPNRRGLVERLLVTRPTRSCTGVTYIVDLNCEWRESRSIIRNRHAKKVKNVSDPDSITQDKRLTIQNRRQLDR